MTGLGWSACVIWRGEGEAVALRLWVLLVGRQTMDLFSSCEGLFFFFWGGGTFPC